MPFIQVTSNLSLSDAEKNNALKTLSQAVAELLDKQEKYVMTCWISSKMTMNASDLPAAFVELRTLRLPDDAPEKLSKELCERLSLTVDLRRDRIYLNFVDMEPTHWGWDGKLLT